MIFKRLRVGNLETNCYIIGDETTKEGLIVDPGSLDKAIIDTVEELGLSLKYILLTHGHGDHILGVEYVKAVSGAKVAIGEKDAPMLLQADLNLASYIGGGNQQFDEADILLRDGDILKCGLLDIKVITTPGHTGGGICYLVGDSLLAGDTLFSGSIGRTDLPTGNYEELIRSVKEKIFTLDPNTKIHPGHGESTTVGIEIKSNPFFRANAKY